MMHFKFGESSTDNQLENEKKRMPRKLVGITIVVVVIVLALAVGVNSYNASANKITRQLNLGYKYLEDLQYEAAAAAFEKVIAIDDKNMAAYAGGIEAYINLGDESALLAFYDKAIAAVENSEKEFLEQDMDHVVEIYLSADQVYSRAPERVVEVLEEGLSITGRGEIKDWLLEKYLAIVEEQNGIENYKEKLEIYDRLLELWGNDERVLESLGKCLTAYMDFLIKEGRYDEVRMLIGKYGDIAAGVDFDKFLRQIEELEGLEEENQEWEPPEESEIRESTDNSEEKINVTDAESGDNWVDDLYRKIIAEDAKAVFAIMEQSDFVEKCEAYPNADAAWSIDYRLSTSYGGNVWAVKAINSDYLAVAYCPEGYDGGWAPAVGWGDYMFEIDDGKKSWFIKSIGYRSDGSMVEIPENSIWTVFHT